MNTALGVEFYDKASGREMLLIDEGESFGGWLCYRHPDGQWVTLRKATEADRRAIATAPNFPPLLVLAETHR